MWWIALAGLMLAGCAAAGPTPAITTTPIQGCDFRMVDLNRRLCEEQRGTFVLEPSWTSPCGACVLP